MQRDIIMVITITHIKLFFFSFFKEELKKLGKEASTDFDLLSQSRNMIGWFMKIYHENQSKFYYLFHVGKFKNV